MRKLPQPQAGSKNFKLTQPLCERLSVRSAGDCPYVLLSRSNSALRSSRNNGSMTFRMFFSVV